MKLHQSFASDPTAFSIELQTSDAPKSVPSSDSQISASLHLLAKGFSAAYIVDLAGTVLANFSPDGSFEKDVDTAIFDVREGQLCTDDPILMQDLGIALTRLRRTKTQFIRSNGIDTVVVLRKISTSVGNFILICPRQEFRLTDDQVYEFGRIFALTKTQCEILRDLCAGIDPDAIKSKRKISLTTVRTHIRSLLRRTKSRDTKALVCDVRNILMPHC
jgi:DNA-binding CsgD family transcriptional regulator